MQLPPGETFIKIDVKERKCCHTWQKKGCWVTQPEFVACPDAKTENDEILLSSVSYETGKPLLFLDAHTFQELARVHFDANIPPDLHGVFIRD